jgi:hypothetical protein
MFLMCLRTIYIWSINVVAETKVPEIKHIKLKEYECRQSKYATFLKCRCDQRYWPQAGQAIQYYYKI